MRIHPDSAASVTATREVIGHDHPQQLPRRNANDGSATCPICLNNAEYGVETNCGHCFCGKNRLPLTALLLKKIYSYVTCFWQYKYRAMCFVNCFWQYKCSVMGTAVDSKNVQLWEWLLPVQMYNFVNCSWQYKYNIIEDVVWLPMRQLSTRDQMTQTLTIIGQCKAFNNE